MPLPLNSETLGDAVIGLQKIIEHIINKDLLQNQKAFSVAHRCMRSLLESMVDLKDIMESSESDKSRSSSESSNSDSSSGSSDDDDSMNVSHRVRVPLSRIHLSTIVYVTDP